MQNVIDTPEFMRAKIEQQIDMWKQHKITTAQLVDYILGYGTDDDVEWLCANFDPMETITKY